jgi:hypothetical protein
LCSINFPYSCFSGIPWNASDAGEQKAAAGTMVSRRVRYEESFLLSKVRGHAKISSSDLFVASKPDFSVLDGKSWPEKSRFLGPVTSTRGDRISSQPAFSAYREYHYCVHHNECQAFLAGILTVMSFANLSGMSVRAPLYDHQLPSRLTKMNRRYQGYTHSTSDGHNRGLRKRLFFCRCFWI